jgi:hypothetical protein
MSLAILYSRAGVGMDAPLVTVEVHLANGLPCMSIVGLPETAVKESKDRVRGAIINSQFEFPMRRITITWHPLIFPRKAAALTWPSHSASLPRQNRSLTASWRTTSLPPNWHCQVNCVACRAYCRWHCKRRSWIARW